MNGDGVWGKRVGGLGKSGPHTSETDAEAMGSHDPMLPRKASVRGSSRPYPKPTQVVR